MDTGLVQQGVSLNTDSHSSQVRDLTGGTGKVPSVTDRLRAGELHSYLRRSVLDSFILAVPPFDLR